MVSLFPRLSVGVVIHCFPAFLALTRLSPPKNLSHIISKSFCIKKTQSYYRGFVVMVRITLLLEFWNSPPPLWGVRPTWKQFFFLRILSRPADRVRRFVKISRVELGSGRETFERYPVTGRVGSGGCQISRVGTGFSLTRPDP